MSSTRNTLIRPTVLTMKNSFAIMAESLSAHPQSVSVGVGGIDSSVADKPVTHTQRLRDELAAGGRMGSARLAKATGLERSVVSSLLKSDIESGRVLRHRADDGVEYELSSAFDADLQRRLKQARVLLVRHGYTVSKET